MIRDTNTFGNPHKKSAVSGKRILVRGFFTLAILGLALFTAIVPASATTSIVKKLIDFEGAYAVAYKDHPDTAGAVGPGYVVDFVGAYYNVRNKTTGVNVIHETQMQFWTDLGVSPTTLNDPRIIYDPISSRFYAVNAGPYMFLAVSKDSDPTHGWQGVVVSKLISGDILPRVGVDVNGVYLCSYGGLVNKITTANCYVMPKADALWTDSKKIDLSRMQTFTNLPYELFPATDFNPGKHVSDPEIFITRQGGQTGGYAVVLLMKTVTWDSKGITPTMNPTKTITTAQTYNTPGNAPQPGTGKPAIKGLEDHRFLNVFGTSKGAYMATGSQINGRIGIEWFQVSPSGTLLQQGTISDPTYDVLFPTIAADSSDNVAIGYTKVSASEFASVYVSARLSTDAFGTLRTPTLLTSGTAAYTCSGANPVGWGTYSSTVIDPSSPTTLWTYQEYAPTAKDCEWHTHWVSFSL